MNFRSVKDWEHAEVPQQVEGHCRAAFVSCNNCVGSFKMGEELVAHEPVKSLYSHWWCVVESKTCSPVLKGKSIISVNYILIIIITSKNNPVIASFS